MNHVKNFLVMMGLIFAVGCTVRSSYTSAANPNHENRDTAVGNTQNDREANAVSSSAPSTGSTSVASGNPSKPEPSLPAETKTNPKIEATKHATDTNGSRGGTKLSE